MAAQLKYPPELRRRAVEMYRSADPKPVIRQIARDLGVHHEALRNWIRQDEADRGERDDRLTTAEKEELAALRKENAELRRSCEILKAGSVQSTRQCNIPGDGGCDARRGWGVRACRTHRSESCGTAGRPESRSARSRGHWAGHQARSSRSLSPTADTCHRSGSGDRAN
ncbi:transposase [Kitasatospora sp. NPDC059648]|uniref:transposase n=1 Tax=Kitasatospora sp. NPDC059648 TaxID=3346894 RepID=UPI0036BCA1C0